MRKIFSKFDIFKKILLTHITIAVTVIIAFTLIISFAYRSFMYAKNTQSFQEINRQIGINVDSFFYNFYKLAETPYYTEDVRYALEKGIDVGKSPNNTLVASQNMAVRMFLSNQKMHSMYITFDKMGVSYSRGYIGGVNYSYHIEEETWFLDLYDLKGKIKVLPLHQQSFAKPNSPQVLSVARCLVKPFTDEPLGIIVINIDPDSLKTLMERTADQAVAVTCIVDENDKVAYSTSPDFLGINIREEGLISNTTNDAAVPMKYKGKKVLVVSELAPNTGLRVVSIVPTAELNREVNQIILACCAVGAVLVVFAALIAVVISRSITKPIKKLTNAMYSIENNDWNISVQIDGEDEIAYLSSTFNSMIIRIKELIQTVIQESDEKRKAEVLALQSQINPHFMYNSLNTIKLMAEIQGNVSIAEAINSFIELLRYCTKNADDEVTCLQEVGFIEHYVSLMKLRYFNRFSFEKQIEEGILEFKMLKFVIQPFIENAIFHGFSDESRDDYHILLSARTEENCIVFCVKDNGSGIADTKIVYNINHKKTDGMNSIGMSNVVERIKHHYGQEYGIQVESNTNGTCVVIRLPKIV